MTLLIRNGTLVTDISTTQADILIEGEAIVADKWRWLTFLYTTGEYLLKASTLNDLVIQSEERTLLWKSLRERAQNEQLYKADLPDANISSEALMALLGIWDRDAPYLSHDGGLDDAEI